MERCTIRLKTGEARCSQLDGNVVVERLAAYEDTGLTPEEIKAPFTEDAMINLAAQALGMEPSRLRELAEADKDGRVVVLPYVHRHEPEPCELGADGKAALVHKCRCGRGYAENHHVREAAAGKNGGFSNDC